MSKDILSICEEICTRDNKHYEFNIIIKPNPRNYKGMDFVEIIVEDKEETICTVNALTLEEALTKMQKSMNKPKVILHEGKKYLVIQEIEDKPDFKAGGQYIDDSQWVKYR